MFPDVLPACSQMFPARLWAKHHQKHSQHGQGGGDVEKCAAETSDAQVDQSLVKFLLPNLLTALQLILVQPGTTHFMRSGTGPISRHGQKWGAVHFVNFVRIGKGPSENLQGPRFRSFDHSWTHPSSTRRCKGSVHPYIFRTFTACGSTDVQKWPRHTGKIWEDLGGSGCQ